MTTYGIHGVIDIFARRLGLNLCMIFFKVVWYPKTDQKVCLNMMKKDQLCAIALKKRN